MTGVDWNTISTAVAVILAIAVGYLAPKIRALNKTIYLNQKQKEAASQLMGEIRKAIADGKITPSEQIDILKKFEEVFQTQKAEEIGDIINAVLAAVRKE